MVFSAFNVTPYKALLFLEKQLTKGRKSDIIRHVAEKR